MPEKAITEIASAVPKLIPWVFKLLCWIPAGLAYPWRLCTRHAWGSRALLVRGPICLFGWGYFLAWFSSKNPQSWQVQFLFSLAGPLFFVWLIRLLDMYDETKDQGSSWYMGTPYGFAQGAKGRVISDVFPILAGFFFRAIGWDIIGSILLIIGFFGLLDSLRSAAWGASQEATIRDNIIIGEHQAGVASRHDAQGRGEQRTGSGPDLTDIFK